MTPGLTSIIIPAYNAAQTLQAAIASALAQTAPVEVIVVDDGSTDGTALMQMGGVVLLVRPHQGVAAARNTGIEFASGEFIQFLDADDTIDPGKVAAQIAALDAGAGWIICDTRIIETNGRAQLASERYGYAARRIDGWVADQLAVGNFIPVHAPLYRRTAIGDIRFPDGELEDWYFVHAVAEVARVRYLPDMLCTYQKRAGSRNSKTRRDPATAPGVALPLRLNLGCGKPGAESWNPIRGMVNLDKSFGWRFEDGLGDFADGSVAGITVSHALMYVAIEHWPRIFREFARVLAPEGVIRITEDDSEHPESCLHRQLWRGSEPGITMTGPAMCRRHLEGAGFTVHDVREDETLYADKSLLQARHRPAPHCFWIEGVRTSALLLEPHADDGALFSAFTTIRYRPRVVTCFPSAGDYGSTEERHAESIAAAAILGAGPVEQWDGRDLERRMRALDAKMRPARVFAPSAESSHPDHVAVALAAQLVFGDRLTQYQTYDAAGKVRHGDPVPFDGDMLKRKQQALTCYRTQIEHPRAGAFFNWDLCEYVAC